MKRQRGRGRKPGGGHQHYNQHQPNRALESNGPEVKVRGPASHIYERYLQLARDAASSGDRVLSENYLQHADHYFRLVRAMQPAAPVQPQGDRGYDADAEGEEDGAPETGAAHERETAEAGGDQPDVEFPQGQQPQQFERDGEGQRRRRGRRSRFRPEGEREGGEPREDERGERREGAEAREGGQRGERRESAEGREGGQRSERREREGAEAREGGPRRERRERETDDDASGREGFSDGPKPAFLRGD